MSDDSVVREFMKKQRPARELSDDELKEVAREQAEFLEAWSALPLKLSEPSFSIAILRSAEILRELLVRR